MKIKINGKLVDIKTVSISAKCSDLCSTQLIDADGIIHAEHDGYVPSFFPDDGGDYVCLDIDLDTLKVTNWKPSKKKIQEVRWSANTF